MPHASNKEFDSAHKAALSAAHKFRKRQVVTIGSSTDSGINHYQQSYDRMMPKLSAGRVVVAALGVSVVAAVTALVVQDRLNDNGGACQSETIANLANKDCYIEVSSGLPFRSMIDGEPEIRNALQYKVDPSRTEYGQAGAEGRNQLVVFIEAEATQNYLGTINAAQGILSENVSIETVHERLLDHSPSFCLEEARSIVNAVRTNSSEFTFSDVLTEDDIEDNRIVISPYDYVPYTDTAAPNTPSVKAPIRLVYLDGSDRIEFTCPTGVES